MSAIYNYISYENILHVHDYTTRDKVNTYTNVLFRTSTTSFHSFQSQLAVVDNKCISISNKQLSFLPSKLDHFIGPEYACQLRNQYDELCSSKNHIVIDEPVFLFFDYESVSGTGHAYDLMFYLLYVYINHNIPAKLLIVKSNNIWYNSLLSLIKTWYNIEYYTIDENITYSFTTFTCAQTYQNILFSDVKEFINHTLIQPILTKYDTLNYTYYKNIYKIKLNEKGNTNRISTEYEVNPEFTAFTENNNYVSLNPYSEEEKIYLLNKATNIIITWGSSWYININYYTNNLINKYIYIIYHPNIVPEYNFLLEHGDCIRQNMPSWASGGYTNQNYNTTTFSGKKMIVSTLSEIPLHIHH